MYTLSCLARIRSNGRSFNHHCSSGIRCLETKVKNTSSISIVVDRIYVVSVFDLRVSIGVKTLCRFNRPKTTALSGELHATLPSGVAAFSINETAYVTALQPNFVPYARSNGVGKPP